LLRAGQCISGISGVTWQLCGSVQGREWDGLATLVVRWPQLKLG
jgi:hypothetical protein